MEPEQAKTTTVTLYPSQIEKIKRMMNVLRLRSFSQVVQRIVDDAEEPVGLGVGSSAEKSDTREGAGLAGNIGA